MFIVYQCVEQGFCPPRFGKEHGHVLAPDASRPNRLNGETTDEHGILTCQWQDSPQCRLRRHDDVRTPTKPCPLADCEVRIVSEGQGKVDGL
jgi:hypothetical protein